MDRTLLVEEKDRRPARIALRLSVIKVERMPKTSMPLGQVPRKVADRKRCAICLSTFFSQEAHEIKFARDYVKDMIVTNHRHSIGSHEDFMSLIRVRNIDRSLDETLPSSTLTRMPDPDMHET